MVARTLSSKETLPPPPALAWARRATAMSARIFMEILPAKARPTHLMERGAGPIVKYALSSYNRLPLSHSPPQATLRYISEGDKPATQSCHPKRAIKLRRRFIALLAVDDPLDALGQLFRFEVVVAVELGRHVVRKADLSERLAHFLPVHVPLEELHELARIPLVVLQVDAVDPLAERPDPILGPAVFDDVADVEVGPHPRALEVVDEPGEFERRQKEVVPNLLDRDHDLALFRRRDHFLDPLDRALVRLDIPRLRIDDRGDEEKLRRAQRFCATKPVLQIFHRLVAFGRVGVREEPLPSAVDDRVNRKPHFV